MTKPTDLSINLIGKQGRIFVVDNDPDTREALCVLFEMVGWPVSGHATVEEFLAACTESREGCIIVEANMPDMRGPELQEELLRRKIRIPILFLTGNGTVPLATNTMRRGAIDFLTKPAPGWLLIERVEEAINMSRDVIRKEESKRQADAALASLTPRESEIMSLIVAGHSNKEIARILDISDRTVENHRAHIMSKTRAENLLALVRMALDANDAWIN